MDAQTLPPFALASLAGLAVATMVVAIGVATTTRIARRLACPAVFLAAFSSSAAMAFLIPPFEGPDEAAHYDFVAWVAQHGGLPTTMPDPRSSWPGEIYQWQQQPFYYLAAARAATLAHLPGGPTACKASPTSRLSGGDGFDVCQLQPHADRLRVTSMWLRLLGSLMSALTVALVFGAIRRVLDVPAGVAAALATTLPLTPQWSALMAYVSNDGLVTLLATAAVWLVVVPAGRAARSGTPGRHSALEGRVTALTAGLVAGLALATKLTALFVVPFGLIAVVGLWSGPLRRRLALAGVFAAGVVLAVAWVPLRDYVVFGDPLARAFKASVLVGLGRPEPVPPWDPRFAGVFVTFLMEPFWARFGSLGAGPAAGSWTWPVYYALTAFSGLGVAVGCVAALTARRTRRLGLVLVAGLIIGLTIWVTVSVVPLSHVILWWSPRHVQPLTLPAMLVFAFGLRMLATPLSSRVRAGLAIGVLVVLGACYAASVRSILTQLPLPTGAGVRLDAGER